MKQLIKNECPKIEPFSKQKLFSLLENTKNEEQIEKIVSDILLLEPTNEDLEKIVDLFPNGKVVGLISDFTMKQFLDNILLIPKEEMYFSDLEMVLILSVNTEILTEYFDVYISLHPNEDSLLNILNSYALPFVKDKIKNYLIEKRGCTEEKYNSVIESIKNTQSERVSVGVGVLVGLIKERLKKI